MGLGLANPGRLAASRWVCGVAALALWLGALSGLCADKTQRSVEAAFLYNFVKFISWPDARMDQPDRAVSICIVGDNVFGEMLDDIVKAGNRKGVRVLKLGQPSGVCHLAFISFDSKDESEKAIKYYSSSPTVTVSERDSFLEDGGTIQFFTESSRVRFSVSTAGLSARGVTISSHMLSLAAKVVSD